MISDSVTQPDLTPSTPPAGKHLFLDYHNCNVNYKGMKRLSLGKSKLAAKYNSQCKNGKISLMTPFNYIVKVN